MSYVQIKFLASKASKGVLDMFASKKEIAKNNLTKSTVICGRCNKTFYGRNYVAIGGVKIRR
jgi:hypothetical protein